MVFNSTFNNFSVILWRSVLLVEGTGVPIAKYLLVTLQVVLYLFQVYFTRQYE